MFNYISPHPLQPESSHHTDGVLAPEESFDKSFLLLFKNFFLALPPSLIPPPRSWESVWAEWQFGRCDKRFSRLCCEHGVDPRSTCAPSDGLTGEYQSYENITPRVIAARRHHLTPYTPGRLCCFSHQRKPRLRRQVSSDRHVWLIIRSGSRQHCKGQLFGPCYPLSSVF